MGVLRSGPEESILSVEQPVARKSRTKCRTGRRVCVGANSLGRCYSGDGANQVTVLFKNIFTSASSSREIECPMPS